MTKVIPLETIRLRDLPGEQFETVCRLYPDGVPLTHEAAMGLKAERIDITWEACHLLDVAGRRDFILFTMRQRQASLVRLLEGAGLAEHAQAVAALDWADLEQAVTVLAAARGVAVAAVEAATDAAAAGAASAATVAVAEAAANAVAIIGADTGAEDAAMAAVAATLAAWAAGAASTTASAAAWREQIDWLLAALG